MRPSGPRWRRAAASLTLAPAVAAILGGCSDLGSPVRPTVGVPDPATVSFAADIQSIFTARCVVCHGPPAPNAGMNLSAGVSYANLVGVVSTGYAPARRIVPGDTTASVLFNKVFGTGRYGATMPLGGSLSQAERHLIRTWIVEGAQNN